MRIQIMLLAAAAAMTAGAAQAASVELRDAVVRVTVVPEDRSDVKVEVTRPNADLPLSISTSGDRTVIDGGLDHRIRSCDGMRDDGKVRVRDVGDVRWADMPQVVIHTPRAVVLEASGAVAGVIGRSASLDLRNSGCSNWTIADVAADAVIRESGAGSVRMGAADRLAVHLSGAGGIHATRVRQVLDARLSGAGGVRIDDVRGVMEAQVSGVGQVKIATGKVSTARVLVSGIGGVEYGGSADTLNATISGLGSVRVNEVTGQVNKSISGGGRVSIGNRPS